MTMGIDRPMRARWLHRAGAAALALVALTLITVAVVAWRGLDAEFAVASWMSLCTP